MSQLPPSQPPQFPDHTDGTFSQPLDSMGGGLNPEQPGPMDRPTGPRMAFTPIAWILIICCTGVMFYISNAPLPPPENGQIEDNSVAEAVMELQSKLIVGMAQGSQTGPGATNQGPSLLGQVEPLNVGPVSQRDRFIILVTELADPVEAEREMQALDQLIQDTASQRASAGITTPVMTPEIEQSHAILRGLYSGALDSPDYDLNERIDALSNQDRTTLKDQYGWFGELALVPPSTTDTAARTALLGNQTIIAGLVVLGFILLGIVAVLGLAGLITMLVLTAIGKLKSGILKPAGHTGVYAETFALWLLVFFGMQFLLTITALALNAGPTGQMGLSVGGFFASLLVLAWPVARGIAWRDVRQDIGWTAGRNPVLEPLIGVAGYAMGLPILAIGLVITLVLLTIAGGLGGMDGDPLSPAGGPAHPIAGQAGSAGLGLKLLIMLLASVAAPIVEETMFRGVLYRHLRASSRSLGMAGSIIMGTLLNSFIFAAIHPQGWFAIPALMSLAIVFTLLREWRGTIIPSILVHGISNGIIIGTLMIVI